MTDMHSNVRLFGREDGRPDQGGGGARFRAYPRYEQSRPEHLVPMVNCGHCQEPVLPHGALLLFDRRLTVEPDSFVLVEDSEQKDFGGYATKFLRRTGEGSLELLSNLGRKPLTSQRIVGTLVAVYLPATDDLPATELDSELRKLVDQAMAGESARRDQVMADAVSRWGRPPRQPGA